MINTSILVASSFTFHRASKELMKNAMGACRGWLLITAVMGILFLAGQMVEYFELPFGLTDNLYASTFYALTGFSRPARVPGGADDLDRVVPSGAAWALHTREPFRHCCSRALLALC